MPGQKLPEETRREDMLRAAYDVAARRGLEGLTVRAVAARAGVSHGTVLFHFRRRDHLAATLLDRVLEATAVLRVSDDAQRLARPAERFHAVLRAEMDRLTAEPRRFRLFLEYWTLGVRDAAIRRKVGAALERYRAAFRALAEAAAPPGDGALDAERGGPAGASQATPQGVAAAAVSVVHGCALQAVIDPKGFDVRQHLDAAAGLLARLAAGAAAGP